MSLLLKFGVIGTRVVMLFVSLFKLCDVISDILSGSLSPHTPRDKENEHEAKSKGNSRL